MSKYGVFSGPYFPVFGLGKTPYLDTFHAVVDTGYASVLGYFFLWLNCDIVVLEIYLNHKFQWQQEGLNSCIQSSYLTH